MSPTKLAVANFGLQLREEELHASSKEPEERKLDVHLEKIIRNPS